MRATYPRMLPETHTAGRADGMQPKAHPSNDHDVVRKRMALVVPASAENVMIVGSEQPGLVVEALAQETNGSGADALRRMDDDLRLDVARVVVAEDVGDLACIADLVQGIAECRLLSGRHDRVVRRRREQRRRETAMDVANRRCRGVGGRMARRRS